MHKETMDAIFHKIKEYDTVMLFRHFRPDGDCKGATKGLQRILQLSFPEKKILLINDDHSDYLAFLGDDEADVDGAWDACHSIFGLVSLCRCHACEKDMDSIYNAVEAYLGDDLDFARSFKVESKRADKRFPLTSIQISQEIGGKLAEAHPTCTVDVHNPEYTVYVEVRDLAAYVHGPAEPGAGGLPTGVGGRAMCLLSGGIDSPVAAYMIAKRGVEIECIHFFSYPYTSELAKNKVLELTGGYTATFLMLLGLTFVALILNIFVRKP